MRVRRVLAAGATILAISSLAVASAAAVDAGDGATPDTAPTPSRPQLASELRALAQAWSDGGGAFGYPFWEKAGQRWRQKQVTTTMYREYVTGYRDRLVLGCPLVDSVDVEEAEAVDVKELLVEACTRRIDGLRAQQQWLDELVHEAGRDPDADADAIAERIAEREAQATEALQDSWRGTRLAMDSAQAALDAIDEERLAEDAFL